MKLNFLNVLCLLALICDKMTEGNANTNIQKRQSDQRLAELETLLSLHKYGGGGRRAGGRNSVAYGLLDFNYIGRKKKSSGSGQGSLERPKHLHSLLPLSPTLTTVIENFPIKLSQSASWATPLQKSSATGYYRSSGDKAS